MTTRLKKLIQTLPKHNNNVLETAKAVGYSESYANTHIYKTLRKYQKSDEDIKIEFLSQADKDEKRFRSKRGKDNSAYCRTRELKAQVLGIGEINKSESKIKFINSPDEKNELESIRGRIGLLQPTEN